MCSKMEGRKRKRQKNPSSGDEKSEASVGKWQQKSLCLIPFARIPGFGALPYAVKSALSA